jgi:hypothetical protein
MHQATENPCIANPTEAQNTSNKILNYPSQDGYNL